MEATETKQASLVNISFTNVDSQCIVRFVARLKHIVAALSKQTIRRWNAVSSAQAEISRLLEAHQRYMELSSRLPSDDESAKIGTALILNMRIKVDSDADAYDEQDRELVERRMQADDIPISPEELDLSQYPLWKIIRELLRQVPEMRVYEIEDHLRSFGVKASRMAIESALATHSKQFHTLNRGREKYVAWKEVPDAPATKYEGRGRKRK